MTEQVEQEICIKFCIKLEHSPAKTSEDRSYGQLVNGNFITATCLLSYHTLCRVFVETSNHPGDPAPLQPRLGTLQLLAFPKTKITFEMEEISDHGWDSGKYNGTGDGDSNKGFCSVLNSGRDAGRSVWGPKVPTLKWSEVSFSYIFWGYCIFFIFGILYLLQ